MRLEELLDIYVPTRSSHTTTEDLRIFVETPDDILEVVLVSTDKINLDPNTEEVELWRT